MKLIAAFLSAGGWAVLTFCPLGCEIPTRGIADDLEVTEATLYRWKQQALVDRGEAPGMPTVESVQLRHALNRIKQLEEELRATRVAAKILTDTTINPKGDVAVLESCSIRSRLGTRGLVGVVTRGGLSDSSAQSEPLV
ncbi:hypothetical protein [Nocardia brasiliensis]|uniref:hypothetical protein n=1 Tax=Nocardia brasiliensis TaxID=37326 RepID=UPI001895AA92|nr:hypothetical protein [Nocardia brasiliensis]MBF6543413.1 hypothetical protein [Nocardia brasiliensis]